jgi:hypothetical protein
LCAPRRRDAASNQAAPSANADPSLARAQENPDFEVHDEAAQTKQRVTEASQQSNTQKSRKPQNRVLNEYEKRAADRISEYETKGINNMSCYELHNMASELYTIAMGSEDPSALWGVDRKKHDSLRGCAETEENKSALMSLIQSLQTEQ